MISPTIIKALLIAAVIAAAAIAWTRFLDYQQSIGYQRRVSEDAVQLNHDLTQARNETERLFRIHDKALAEGAQREKDLKAKLAGVTAASGRLRDDLTEYRRRLSEYPVETCRAYADAGLRLLGTCLERYRDVAAGAKGHLNDWQTLNEGWPQ